MTIYHESELYHHGVKGMKWGVRKNKTSISQRVSERRAVYKRGEKIYEDLTDNGKHDRESDFYKNRYKQLSKKQIKDVESYRHDYNTQLAVVGAITAIGMMSVRYLYKRHKEERIAQELHDMGL